LPQSATELLLGNKYKSELLHIAPSDYLGRPHLIGLELKKIQVCASCWLTMENENRDESEAPAQSSWLMKILSMMMKDPA
jgi:hypothetical protein